MVKCGVVSWDRTNVPGLKSHVLGARCSTVYLAFVRSYWIDLVIKIRNAFRYGLSGVEPALRFLG